MGMENGASTKDHEYMRRFFSTAICPEIQIQDNKIIPDCHN